MFGFPLQQPWHLWTWSQASLLPFTRTPLLLGKQDINSSHGPTNWKHKSWRPLWIPLHWRSVFKIVSAGTLICHIHQKGLTSALQFSAPGRKESCLSHGRMAFLIGDHRAGAVSDYSSTWPGDIRDSGTMRRFLQIPVVPVFQLLVGLFFCSV